MKKTLLTLGAAALVSLAITSVVSAAQVYNENFNDGKLHGSGEVYIAGDSDLLQGDPFMVKDGILVGGNSDAVRDLFVFQTGDVKWTNYSFSTKFKVNNQGTGAMGWIVRGQDPKNYYEVRYTTNRQSPWIDEELSGITAPNGSPNVRILKVVDNVYTLLSEKEGADVPAFNNGGAYVNKWGTMKITAVGDTITAYISVDGINFIKVGEIKDSTFAAGKIGLTEYNYDTLYDDLTVDLID